MYTWKDNLWFKTMAIFIAGMFIFLDFTFTAGQLDFASLLPGMRLAYYRQQFQALQDRDSDNIVDQIIKGISSVLVPQVQAEVWSNYSSSSNALSGCYNSRITASSTSSGYATISSDRKSSQNSIWSDDYAYMDISGDGKKSSVDSGNTSNNAISTDSVMVSSGTGVSGSADATAVNEIFDTTLNNTLNHGIDPALSGTTTTPLSNFPITTGNNFFPGNAGINNNGSQPLNLAIGPEINTSNSQANDIYTVNISANALNNGMTVSPSNEFSVATPHEINLNINPLTSGFSASPANEISLKSSYETDTAANQIDNNLSISLTNAISVTASTEINSLSDPLSSGSTVDPENDKSLRQSSANDSTGEASAEKSSKQIDGNAPQAKTVHDIVYCDETSNAADNPQLVVISVPAVDPAAPAPEIDTNALKTENMPVIAGNIRVKRNELADTRIDNSTSSGDGTSCADIPDIQISADFSSDIDSNAGNIPQDTPADASTAATIKSARNINDKQANEIGDILQVDSACSENPHRLNGLDDILLAPLMSIVSPVTGMQYTANNDTEKNNSGNDDDWMMINGPPAPKNDNTFVIIDTDGIALDDQCALPASHGPPKTGKTSTKASAVAPVNNTSLSQDGTTTDCVFAKSVVHLSKPAKSGILLTTDNNRIVLIYLVVLRNNGPPSQTSPFAPFTSASEPVDPESENTNWDKFTAEIKKVLSSPYAITSDRPYYSPDTLEQRQNKITDSSRGFSLTIATDCLDRSVYLFSVAKQLHLNPTLYTLYDPDTRSGHAIIEAAGPEKNRVVIETTSRAQPDSINDYLNEGYVIISSSDSLEGVVESLNSGKGNGTASSAGQTDKVCAESARCRNAAAGNKITDSSRGFSLTIATDCLDRSVYPFSAAKNLNPTLYTLYDPDTRSGTRS